MENFYISILMMAMLASCVSDTKQESTQPRFQAKLVEDDGKNEGISISEVLNIAKNRAEMSCNELIIGSLYSSSLKQISSSKMVEADESTKSVAGAVGGVSDKVIEQELTCHCDRGTPMPSYAIFERRGHLQKNKNNRVINQTLANFYPKDEAGKPRFLQNGEKLERSVLERLPVAPKTERFDDCGRSCKKARTNVNAKAKAEGKPEPYPNLEYPKKKPCIDGVRPAG